MFEIISKSNLFKGLELSELKAYFKEIHYQIRSYQKNSLIAQKGEACNNLIIVLKGSVKGEMLNASGKIIKIEDIEAPRPLAPAFLFGQYNSYPVDIIANDYVELLVLPKTSVIKLMQSNQAFLINFLDSISNRSQFLSQKLYFFSFKSLKQKLANYFIELHKQAEKSIFLSKTHQELADLFGVTRPSLSRAISEMVKKKIIGVNRKEIIIIDRNQLTSL